MTDYTGVLTIKPATSEWSLNFAGGLGGFLELEPIQAVADPAILEMLGK